MAGAEHPSELLVLQCLRDRAIETLEVLADGDAGVRQVGTGEYVVRPDQDRGV